MPASRRIAVDPRSWTPADLEPARLWIAQGHIVAFPTDTFYGLAVDPTSAQAVEALFDLKGRDASAAIPLIGSALDEVVRAVGEISAGNRRLAAVFWPGPLSLVFDVPPEIAERVHGGRKSVAVRVPNAFIARQLARVCGGLLTATSANRSGEPPASNAAALGRILEDPRVLVLDAGAAPGGLPSTIVDARRDEPELIREGAIAWSRVLESLHG